MSLMSQSSYLTLPSGREFNSELIDKRSRFIAQLVHVDNERAADEFIEQIRARHHDARHHVPAWILSDGRERCSDDGEPRGTGGMPVLEVLRGAGLVDVCCVVTRYFGGTLLGPGGLMRAYSGATNQVVQRAREEDAIVEMTLVTPVTCVIPYAAYGRVERLVQDNGGKIRDSIFMEDVQLNCVFHAGDEIAFIEAMRELAAGDELCSVGESRFAEF